MFCEVGQRDGKAEEEDRVMLEKVLQTEVSQIWRNNNRLDEMLDLGSGPKRDRIVTKVPVFGEIRPLDEDEEDTLK